MYVSKYYTNEEIDQRLLQGYFDDFVKAGFAGTINEFWAFVLSIANKVDKREGYDLSKNDFTDKLKEKLEGIEERANYITKLSQLENDTKFQTEEQVRQAISDLIDGADDALDTLKELAEALGNDPNFATTITNKLTDLRNALTDEVNRAKEEEGKLSTQISEVNSNFIKAVDLLNDKIDTAVTNLINKIDKIEAKVDKNTADIADLRNETTGSLAEAKAYAKDLVDKEAELRKTADDALSESIHQLNTLHINDKAELKQDIAAEAQLRANADANIQLKLTEEITNRQTGDAALESKLSDEVVNRKAADETLQNSITKEVADRTNADNTLQVNIDKEAQARESADQVLQTNINSEAATRTAQDQILDQKITALSEKTDGDKSDVLAAIEAEKEARIAADADLNSKKVDKREGYSLTKNDFTDLLLAKLNGIEEHANYITLVSQLANDAGYQTEAEVEAAIQKIIGSAPEVLDTLEEIAKALGDDPNFATTMTQKLNELTTKIETETEKRVEGDAALDAKLTTLSTTLTKTVEDLRTYVTETRTELLARANNQDALITQNAANIQRNLELIQGIQNNISGSYLEVKALLETEIAARKAEDIRLEGKIDQNTADLGTEREERKAADKALQDALDAEEAARTAADTALGVRIDTEIAERKAADKTLQDNIDAEEYARTQEDTRLNARIDNEEDAREAADTTLQDNIDAEETARTEADTTLQDNIDATNAHTINTHRLDSNPVLNGTDIKLDGYEKNAGTTPTDLDVKVTDTASAAFGKVQKRIEVDKADADDKITKVKTAVGLTEALALPSLEDTNYLSESSNIVDGMKELDKQIADGRHDEVWEVLYTQFTQISGFSVSPTIIEKGVDADITIRGNNLFNSKPLVPETLSVKRGTTVINSTPIASLNIKDTLNTEDDRTTYTLSITSKGVTKTATANVNAYYPMYFGHSAKAALTGEDVLGLTKQAIKSSPNGTYNMTGIAEGEYVWLCVPSNFSITKVTSSGFGVPMAAAATVTVEGKGSYKCYRTEGALKAGNFNFVIG